MGELALPGVEVQVEAAHFLVPLEDVVAAHGRVPHGGVLDPGVANPEEVAGEGEEPVEDPGG